MTGTTRLAQAMAQQWRFIVLVLDLARHSVVHACKLSMQEAEAGGLLQVQGQPGYKVSNTII